MDKWKFAVDNEDLINLVLLGKKIATTSLFKGKIEPIGEKSLILHDDDSPACMIMIKKVIITKFKDITEEEAALEGEGDLSLSYWKEVHRNLFSNFTNFNDDTLVMMEIFELMEKY